MIITITILTHDEWKLWLVRQFYVTWAIRDNPQAVIFVDFFVDVSADPGTSEQLDTDYFYPDQASSFNAQLLTEGFITHRTHTWHDLIHLKFQGIVPAIAEEEVPHPSRVTPGYINLRGGSSYGTCILGGPKPIWNWATMYYELWSGREYESNTFVYYWPWYYNSFIVLWGSTPKTFKEGYIVDEWATHPTFVPSRQASVDLYCFCNMGDGTFKRKKFNILATFHASWSGSEYQRYFSGLCLHNIAEWRSATMSTNKQDPASWSSYFNPIWRPKSSRAFAFAKPDFQSVKDVLFSGINRGVNWHEMASMAYQDLGMADINGVANLKELLEMGSAVMSFTKTLKSIPVKRVKAAASAWLAVHYGFKLTILDAKELYSTLNDFTYRRSSLSKANASSSALIGYQTYKYQYQVFFDVFAQLRSELLRCLAISDAFLTLENAWDMVPWSFVIDWFVDLGSVLQSLDNWFNLRQRHEVVAVGRSVSSLKSVDSSFLGLAPGITLDASYYAREYTKELISPSITPSVTLNPFNHLVEAAALIISIR